MVRLCSPLPPEIALLGARPSQAQQCCSSGHLLISVPSAESIVWAMAVLIPWTATQSTPGIRRRCARVLLAGAFWLWEGGVRGGVVGLAGQGSSGAGSQRAFITEKAR